MPRGEYMELGTVLITEIIKQESIRNYWSIYLLKPELGTEYLIDLIGTELARHWVSEDLSSESGSHCKKFTPPEVNMGNMPTLIL